jgi:oxalate decarboxylase/phosphoglucose isomerase-like protein (cupin superfamily)
MESQTSGNKLSASDFDHLDFPGGLFLRANHKKFKALRGLAIQVLKLKPKAIREAHSHPNAEQLDYCVSGKARVGIIGPDGHRQLLDLEEGDISFVPRGYIHWIENRSEKPLHFIVVLSHEQPETIELSETLTGVPDDTLVSMLGVNEKFASELPKGRVTIGGAL